MSDTKVLSIEDVLARCGELTGAAAGRAGNCLKGRRSRFEEEPVEQIPELNRGVRSRDQTRDRVSVETAHQKGAKLDDRYEEAQ